MYLRITAMLFRGTLTMCPQHQDQVVATGQALYDESQAQKVFVNGEAIAEQQKTEYGKSLQKAVMASSGPQTWY
jgi:hypothetical protein